MSPLPTLWHWPVGVVKFGVPMDRAATISCPLCSYPPRYSEYKAPPSEFIFGVGFRISKPSGYAWIWTRRRSFLHTVGERFGNRPRITQASIRGGTCSGDPDQLQPQKLKIDCRKGEGVWGGKKNRRENFRLQNLLDFLSFKDSSEIFSTF